MQAARLTYYSFQVKAFVNQVEQSAKKQLKSSWEKTPNAEQKHHKESSKSKILAASRNPTGTVVMTSESDKSPTVVEETLPPPPLPPPVVKPQFYFGQTMTELVRGQSSSATKNGIYQTAIDKVKQNEALTHPKRAEELQSKVTELNDKGRHMSIITTSAPASSSSPSSQNGGSGESKAKFSPKAASLSSGVSSLSSSSSSSNSSTRSSPAKDVNSSPKAPLRPVEPSQDTVRKAFEAQLIAGKNRLKKVEDEVGQTARLPPAPVPPPAPPPPPTEEAFVNKNGSSNHHLRSYEIPQAPKLKKTPPNLASKKGLVAPNGLNAREELMMAIRGTGGFQGLRKVIQIKTTMYKVYMSILAFSDQFWQKSVNRNQSIQEASTTDKDLPFPVVCSCSDFGLVDSIP